MDANKENKRSNHLLSLPQELLQLILKDVPGKYTLRPTCKAFASVLASCCETIHFRRDRLIKHGARREAVAALAAFSRARRVVISLNGAASSWRPPLEAPFHRHDSSSDDEEDACFAEQAPTLPAQGNHSSTTHHRRSSSVVRVSAPPAPPAVSDEDLLNDAISALSSVSGAAGARITSLAVLHLACPLPPPSALGPLAATLTELELTDASYAAAADQGAFNVLVRGDRLDLCARSDGMLGLALALPQLRRLSLASAVFTVGAVSALGGLTKLESLSLAGSLECGGPTPMAQAAETYRLLLASLTGLRQLRLPMAVASPSAGLMDIDDMEEEEYDDEEEYGAAAGFGGWEGGDAGWGRGLNAVASGGGGVGLFSGGLFGGGGVRDGNALRSATAQGFWHSSGAPMRWEGSGWRESVLSPGTVALAATVPPISILAHIPCSGSGAEVAGGRAAGSPNPTARLAAPIAPPVLPARALVACPVGRLTVTAAAFGGLVLGSPQRSGQYLQQPCQRRKQQRQQQSSPAARGFSFPPHLEDLTIPLCAMNRPVFEAVCDAFGGDAGACGDVSSSSCGGGGGAGCCETCKGVACGGLQLVSGTPSGPSAECCPWGTSPAGRPWGRIRCDPAGAVTSATSRCGDGGSAVLWAGSGSAGRGESGHCRCCCGSSLLRFCSGGIGGVGLAGCAAQQHPPSLGPKNSSSSSSTEDARGRLGPSPCGGCSATSARAGRSGALLSLHIPTLAGYSHWEGSFLETARDFRRLGRLSGLERLHLSLDTGALRMSRAGLRACFQNLRALQHIKDLWVREARGPTLFPTRKRSSGCNSSSGSGGLAPLSFDPAFAPDTGSHRLCATALQQLQRQWPHLQTLRFFSETVVRGGCGRLVMPDSIDDVQMLPPACACCAGPCLMAAARGSVGRWGRGSPRWAEGLAKREDASSQVHDS